MNMLKWGTATWSKLLTAGGAPIMCFGMGPRLPDVDGLLDPSAVR